MRIAVIGAGIGGLVAAIGLQNDGHDVTVFERRSEASGSGAGLTLFSNALSALDAIDLGDVVREVGLDAREGFRFGLRKPSGKWLVKLDAPRVGGVRALLRARLHEALLAQLVAGTVHTDSLAVVGSEGSPTVTVGEQTDTYDLVIGADGLRSNARQQWGLDRGIRYAGYTTWRGVTSAPAVLEPQVTETMGRGRRFGIVPIPDGQVYWFATHTTNAGVDVGDDLAVLRSWFEGWHDPIEELIDTTSRDALLHLDIYDLAQLPPTFVRDRGVLLGDAAHAMTPDLGQGAGQAIEDAATLVLLLRRVNAAAELDSALEAYDRIRRPRDRALWQRSRRTARVTQNPSPIVTRLRDLAPAVLPNAVIASSMKRVQQWEPPGQ